MRNFFRGKNDQRGAVSASYIIGLILIAAVLIGGVALLKNAGNKPDIDNSNDGEIAVVESSETESNGETASTSDNSETQGQVATTGAGGDYVPQTGANSEYVPEAITATGPGDFVATTLGLVLVGATAYTGWNYLQSRRAVSAALLKK
ncbi:hypothetical protein FWG95_03565 [Candidatus Saccharibacteria bacterium]|nr:hypothetical protein [Candidatus Saccharibacteria bacterium]